MKQIIISKIAVFCVFSLVGMEGAALAQQFQLTTLVSLNGTNGSTPQGMVLATDGSLYGTTYDGGTNGIGTLFRLSPDGTFATLAHFAATNGKNPVATMIIGQDGLLYGATELGGGGTDFGCIYRATTNGLVTWLASLNYITTGYEPLGSLIQGSDGWLYGTANRGGENLNGSVFKVTTNGTLETLYNFSGADGMNPKAGLVWGSDGLLYGTTSGGGDNLKGTIFSLSTNGTLNTLVHFTGPNGRTPNAALVLGGDGLFYGTTAQGGDNLKGTVFKVTTNGVLTTLVHFNETNGALPTAALVPGDDGWFYGVAANGGQYGKGTIFKVSTNGDFAALLSFDGTNGATPSVAMTIGADGCFYGTTSLGGADNNGTIFRLAPVPPPLSISSLPGLVVLDWTNALFNLQSAPEVTGVFTNIPGAISPFTSSITGERQFFRLKK